MAKLIVVGENPDTLTTKGLFQRLFFEVIGGELGDMHVSHAISQFDDKEKLTKKDHEEFMQMFKDEVVGFHDVKCIVALGERAMFLTTGAKNVEKNRGVICTIKEEDKPDLFVVPTYGASDIDKTPRLLNLWAKDVVKGLNISKDRASSVSTTKMVYCDTMDKIRQAVEYVQETKLAVFDFETPEIDENLGVFKQGHNATMLSFSFQAGSGYVIPLEHKDSPFVSEFVQNTIMPYLRDEVFENPDIRKVAHNLNYDAHMLRIYDIELRGRIDDTMLMHHLYDETERHGLKRIVETFYPEYAGYDDDLKGFKWSDIPIKILAQYNATDTDLTYRIMVALEDWLLEDPRIYRIYRNLTMSAFKPLFDAETRGMDINAQFLAESIKEVKILLQRAKARLDGHKTVKRYEDTKAQLEVDKMIDEVQAKLDKRVEKSKEVARSKAEKHVAKQSLSAELVEEAIENSIVDFYAPTSFEERYRNQLKGLKAGTILPYEGFNYGSWQQLEDLLYYSKSGFKFPTITGGTGKDILNDLKDKSGFVDMLLSYRSLQKTLGTYLEGIQKRLDQHDRIHTSFLLHGTVSGRLSSRNPNLQNMPNVAKLKDDTLIHAVGLVKKAFCVPEGYTLMQLDYGQAELRTIASFARETTMLDIYNRGLDLHAKTASEMMELTLEQFYELVKEEQKAGRSNAKAVNFGLIYGMSARGFMEYAKNSYGLILTLEEATKIRNTFFATYPKLQDYHDLYIAKGKKFGHVRTLYGRKRRLPKINDPDEYIASMDERAAINSPIQGTSGEFMIFSIALLHNRLDKRVQLVNTIHDSIIFYVPDDMIDYAIKTIKHTMENLPNMQYFGTDLNGVGMVVDVEVSKESWKDLQEISA